MKKIKKNIYLFLKDFPFLRSVLEKKRIKKKFLVEISLLEDAHKNSSSHKSIIHFSLNKCATQYVKGILKDSSAENNLTHVSIQDYAFASYLPFLDTLKKEEMNKYKHIFKPKGYLYSVFGGMVEGIEELEKYLIILMIRDPRDILVSDYFSISYSHPVPVESSNKHKDFINKRQATRQLDVNEYVKYHYKTILSIFDRYQKMLLDKKLNLYITKYEDMVDDFEKWLKELLCFCELNVSDDLMQYFLEKNLKSKPKQEDTNKQTRKGKIGDYKDKLNIETIRFLNSEFAKILSMYNYKS